ncbi:SprT family zinc-dependent metalloprotease [Mesoplasma corruscae]|uniref:Zinc metalloprotease n=1 Tax=Mesoplasma corruscae TaxID=216874 RepID=A0A2S5RHB1_9MOLU|nr:SprT family zinc-dependent metalloprotease [Mesoplasma corruscae]PPE06690.1 zinc metalloprotease [Mesoplasma corruscae]
MYASLNLMSNYKTFKNLLYQGHDIKYTLSYKDQKHIILKVVAGEIKVSAPHFAELWEIERILYKNITKILSVQSNHIVTSVYDLNASQPWIKIMGEKYHIEINEEITRAKIVDKTIKIKNYYDQEVQIKKIYSLIGKEFKNWFISRTIDWSVKMNIPFKNVSVKLMKAKWGYCLPKESKISYNTKLLHFDDEHISYVIIHELAHILHANHSKEFWNFVEQYSPKYREIQKTLNSTGV